MKWLVLLAGLSLAFTGSAAAAALVTTARVALAEAIARRLRGTRESLAWVATAERQVVATTAAASLGAGLVGAAMPGLFDQAAPLELAVVVFLVAVPVILLGGYVLPHWLTATRAERVVDLLRPAITGWTATLGVVLPARNPDPSDEVRALAREGSASGVGAEQLVMVGGVMTFARRPVREVMTPRTNVVAVPHGATYADVEAIFGESGYTRLPVFGSTLDEIVGMVHAFDLFKYHVGDPLPLRPVSVAPEYRPAADVLVDMQRERQHLAVVVDEFGGTAGIVTLEDLLASLVGDIADDDDALPSQPVPGGDLIEVDSTMTTTAVADHFGVELPRGNAVSFGGMIAELAGRIPAAGDRYNVRGLEVDIIHATPTRVERMLVRRHIPIAVPLDRSSA